MHTPERHLGGTKPGPHRRSAPTRRRRTRFGDRLPTTNETSAGGVAVNVIDGVPYVAMIMRKGRAGRSEWCLPKGHLEADETPAQAAVREVREETGIWAQVICPISSVDYWFSGSHSRIHKRVHHFLMEYLHGEITVDNDPDHEAEDAQWVNLHEAAQVLSYANERKVVKVALSLLYPEEREAP